MLVVVQIRGNDLFDDPPANVFGLDREHGLDAAFEIPRHPIGAAQEHLLLRAFAEHQNAAVLEEPVHDAEDANVFGNSRQPWSQAADAADQQVDRHAGLAGFVEGFDRLAGRRANSAWR